MHKIIMIVLLLLIILGGIILAKQGRPYPTFFFTVHKLAALGLVIDLTILVVRYLKGAAFAGPLIIWIVLAGFGILALFVTGALLSLEKGTLFFMRLLHSFGALCALSGVGGLIYYLF